MLDGPELCRGWFSIFEKNSIFPFETQKANSLTFCTKISSDRQIWPDLYWNRAEWTQEMLFNTYHYIRTRIDKKIEIDEKKSNYFFLTNFLNGHFQAPWEVDFQAKNTFSFFIENLALTLKYCQTTIPDWKRNSKLIQKQDPVTFWPFFVLKKACSQMSTIWKPPQNYASL